MLLTLKEGAARIGRKDPRTLLRRPIEVVQEGGNLRVDSAAIDKYLRKNTLLKGVREAAPAPTPETPLEYHQRMWPAEVPEILLRTP